MFTFTNYVWKLNFNKCAFYYEVVNKSTSKMGVFAFINIFVNA